MDHIQYENAEESNSNEERPLRELADESYSETFRLINQYRPPENQFESVAGLRRFAVSVKPGSFVDWSLRTVAENVGLNCLDLPEGISLLVFDFDAGKLESGEDIERDSVPDLRLEQALHLLRSYEGHQTPRRTMRLIPSCGDLDSPAFASEPDGAA